MTATVVRLILSAAVILATVTVFAPVYMIVDSIIGYDIAVPVSVAVCVAFLVVTWLLVWRREVRWTPRRMLLTAASVLAALVPGVCLGFVMLVTATYIDEFVIIIGGFAWASTWLAATALIWRETASERSDRLALRGINAITCPKCGHNLTGLREARCPECGGQFTLDQLYAAAATGKSDLGER